MRCPFPNTFVPALLGAALLTLACPLAANAEICNKIDYTFSDEVYDQVVLYAGNSGVYASDAACILKRIPFDSDQETVGTYLSKILVDPHNIDLLLNAVTFPSTKTAITKAAIDHRNTQAQTHRDKTNSHFYASPQTHHHVYTNPPPGVVVPAPQVYPQAAPGVVITSPQAYPQTAPSVIITSPQTYPQTAPGVVITSPQVYAPPPNAHHKRPHYRHSPPPFRPTGPNHAYNPPPPPKKPVVQNVHQKIDYTFPSKIMDQVRLYVGNSNIYASDAAIIIKSATYPERQIEIATFLCTRLEDPENIDKLVRASDYSRVREKITKSCFNR